jgi:hypothetical protein
MMGQRVFPQRNREPLQRTHRLLPDARAVIWLSAATELLLRFMWSSSQLSVALVLRGLVCRVMVFSDDGCNGFLCFPYEKSSKFKAFPAKNQASSDAKLSKCRVVGALGFYL